MDHIKIGMDHSLIDTVLDNTYRQKFGKQESVEKIIVIQISAEASLCSLPLPIKISLNLTLPLDLPCYFRTFLYPSANVVVCSYGLWHVIGFIPHRFILNTYAHICSKEAFCGFSDLKGLLRRVTSSTIQLLCSCTSFPTGQINSF